jgi:hypothetical protein
MRPRVAGSAGTLARHERESAKRGRAIRRVGGQVCPRSRPHAFANGYKEEVERNIRDAIEFHIEGLKQEGYEVPEPATYSSYIDVAA